MKEKIKVGIIFGGKSGEHEVSLVSAKNVLAALDPEKYETVLIAIAKNGEWFYQDKAAQYLLNADDPQRIALAPSNEYAAILPRSDKRSLLTFNHSNSFQTLDVVFPVLHGTNGEDGTIQGLLKLADIPFVGSGVLATAAGMDKDVMKRLFKEAGIPVARSITLTRSRAQQADFHEITAKLGLPFFIKPANLGSSVGISKVKSESEFQRKLQHALDYDHKIIIEEFIAGREIECAILGNEYPKASLPGEVIPTHEFYSYEAKYLDPNGARLDIPAHLPEEIIAQVQSLAIQAFQTLGCEGMARVDMFLTESGSLYLNEVNTIPGFTPISMYPKLWAVSGLGYAELLDQLIVLALERSQQDKLLKTEFQACLD